MTARALGALALVFAAAGCGSELDGAAAADGEVAGEADSSAPTDAVTAEAEVEASEGDDDATEIEIVPDADTADAPELPTWTPPEDPFDRGVVAITITLEPLARTLLGQDPRSPVPATCTFDGEDAAPCRVALAGEEATFRDLGGKASFALRFDEPVHGLDGLALDGLLSDASHLRTVVAHHLFRRLGLAAPRATLARVVVDGEPFGVYAAVESITSPRFLAAATGGTSGAVFTAERTTDLWPWQVPDLVLVSGDEARRATLDDLAKRLETFRIARLDGAPIPLAEAVGDRVDMGPFLGAMAAEIWLGHAGGYPRGIRDYALHVANGGRVTFLPVRLGASLDPDDEPDPWWSGGRLLRHCLEDPACRPEWGRALDMMVSTLDDVDLLGEASALAFRARAELADDPRREASLDAIGQAQDALLLTLADRSGWIAHNLACTTPGDVDHDGDGASACVDDCDDDDPLIHPGAPERCNLRDDDCDGVLDDGGSCPDCLVVDDPAGGRWALCYAPRQWLAARDDCRERGGELAAVRSLEDHDALRRAALGLDWTSWWIGLHDRDDEGTFVWSDGAALGAGAFRGWADGEPNDSSGEEDCVHLASWADGRWNDLACARELPYACALPPAR
ncbi:MAG: CotH kinase family protein [Deltaproteobacteria bacterium]|nr:CotH kinase family protein [Deltaproteobacteria bacterium]